MSKKLLLATAATLLLAGPAFAGEPLSVKLGGAVDFQAGFVGGDRGYTVEPRDFNTSTQLSVDAEGKADNGLSYGAHLLLSQDASQDGFYVKNSYIHVGTGFGRVEGGAVDGAADRLAVGAPTVGAGQIVGGYTDFMGIQPWNGATKAPSSKESTKLSFYTPSLHGLTVGASYSPQSQNRTSGNWAALSSAQLGGYDDVLEAGARYTGKAGDVSFKLGATVTSAEGRPVFWRGAYEDFTAWQVGASVGYQGLTVGGGYVDAGSFGVRTGAFKGDQRAWNVGVAYDFGNNLAVGASMVSGEGYTSAFSPYATKYDAYAVGASYTVTPGLNVGADYVYVDRADRTGPATPDAKDKSQMFLLSTKVAF